MKKIILSLAMAMTAIGASAQNTYNVRVGGGFSTNDLFSATVMGQANFQFKGGSPWIFSPAMQVAADFDDLITVMAYANMGYRLIIGDGCLFVPKVGIGSGYSDASFDRNGYEAGYLVGPSIDLTFELKHFVIGLTGFYSLNKVWDSWEDYEQYNFSMISLTLGYTF